MNKPSILYSMLPKPTKLKIISATKLKTGANMLIFHASIAI